jgi:signal transduction histidine kinase/DNA-binding response OmpR family regulator/ligand-binding sensor domain-containing protein
MKRTVAICFYLLLPLLALTQKSDYEANISYFTEKDGLSNNDVFCINKDGRGVLWIGTRYGLNRFDGKNFRVFTTNHGLKSNFVSTIFPINERYFMLGFGTPRIYYKHFRSFQVWDTYHNAAQTLSEFSNNLPFSEQVVEQVSYLDNGFLFLLNNGKSYFWDKHKRWIAIDFLGEQEQLLAIEPDEPNAYTWSSSGTEEKTMLIKRDVKGQILQSISLNTVKGKLFWLHTDAQQYHYFAFKTKEGNTRVLSISTQGKQQIVLNLARTKDFFHPEVMAYHAAMDSYWCWSELGSALIDKRGQILWESTYDNLDFDLGRQNYFEAGTIWQWTSKGFVQIQLNLKRFKTLLKDETKPIGVRGILGLGDKIWINAAPKVYQYQQDTVTVLMKTAALATACDSDHSFWLGGQKQLIRIDTITKAVEIFKTEQNEVWSIWKAPDQRLWLSEVGLHCFDPKTKETSRFIPPQGFEEINKATIYHFYPISAHRVWLLSTTGLYELDPLTETIVACYWSGGKGEYYLPTDDVRHLYYDKQRDEFWIATGQAGLLYWQPSTGKTELFSFNSLSTNIMHAVYADEYGFLWLPTDDGIVQWQRATGRFRVYRTQDGLPTNEFNRISHFQDTDGTLYFGSIDGLVVFHPKDFYASFERAKPLPPVVVEVQQYNGKKNKVEEKTSNFLAQQYLKINPSDWFFTLTLALPNYTAAREVIYFYQIKGDPTWQKAASNQLTFWRLPYGKRAILIRAELPDGDYSETLEVKVWAKPPFYLRWWFLLLVALAIGLAFVLRFRALRSQNTKLEQEVERRTEKIKKQAEELRQLDEMKSRFFANISHELRTPLTLITAPLQQLITQEHGTDKKQLVQFAFNNSQRLLRLVNQILDLTKLGNAGLQLEKKEVLLLPLVQRIFGEFMSFADHKNISFNLHHEIDENAVYLLDANKIETILYNLLSNALKFTPQGGKVTLRLKQIIQGVTFEVTDTGRGIAPEDLPYIFDRFYQSQKQKTAEGGTGIGLSLCKELATLMKGSIEVRSEIGVGAIFLLSLPCERSSTAIAPPLEINNITFSRSISVTTQDESLPHLLVVEDNEDLQAYISILLQQDYRLTIADNGKIPLDYLNNCQAQDRPALIISDIMMPEMDGFQLLQHLKNSPHYQKIPVIMLTARAGLDDKLAALRIGVDDYLTKPFVEEELLVRIENLLCNAELRQENPLPLEENILPEISDLWLQNLETLIKNNLQKPTFSVDFLAEQLGYSRQTLNKYLRASVGLTTTDYIKEIRLNLAREHFTQNPNLTIKEVAEMVGMSNVKYFSRLFKERFGKLPSEI